MLLVVGTKCIFDEREKLGGDLHLLHYDLNVFDPIWLEDGFGLLHYRFGSHELLLIFAEVVYELLPLELEVRLCSFFPKGVFYLGCLKHVPADVFHLDLLFSLLRRTTEEIRNGWRKGHLEGWQGEKLRRGREVEGQH
jgi:hypothetical protein